MSIHIDLITGHIYFYRHASRHTHTHERSRDIYSISLSTFVCIHTCNASLSGVTTHTPKRREQFVAGHSLEWKGGNRLAAGTVVWWWLGARLVMLVSEVGVGEVVIGCGSVSVSLPKRPKNK